MRLYDCVYLVNDKYNKATIIARSKIEAEAKLSFFTRSRNVLCTEIGRVNINEL